MSGHGQSLLPLHFLSALIHVVLSAQVKVSGGQSCRELEVDRNRITIMAYISQFEEAKPKEGMSTLVLINLDFL